MLLVAGLGLPELLILVVVATMLLGVPALILVLVYQAGLRRGRAEGARSTYNARP